MWVEDYDAAFITLACLDTSKSKKPSNVSASTANDGDNGGTKPLRQVIKKVHSHWTHKSVGVRSPLSPSFAADAFSLDDFFDFILTSFHE
jgi:hypothetical protein